jgi:hypothetical protein
VSFYPDLRSALSGLLGVLPYETSRRTGIQTCPVCRGRSRGSEDDPDSGPGDWLVRHEPGCARYAAETTAMYHDVPFHEREDLLRAVSEVIAREDRDISGSDLDRAARAVLMVLDVRVRCRPPA